MVEGFPTDKSQLAEARWITPQYFSAMSIPLVYGRLFNAEDYSGKARVAIINQSFARRYFADRSPIGGRISSDQPRIQWSTVVGVIGDVRHSSLEEAPVPQIYHPNADFQSGYIAVRSTLPPKALASAIRSALHTIDPNLAAGGIQTMGDLESKASASRRFQTSLLTVFAAIALLLALSVFMASWPIPSAAVRVKSASAWLSARSGRTWCCWSSARPRSCLRWVSFPGSLPRGLPLGPFRHCSSVSVGTTQLLSCSLRFARGLRLDRCLYSRSPRSLRRSHASTSGGVGDAEGKFT